MTKQPIDPDKFRRAIRQLPDEQIYRMLSDAVEMLPPSKLERLARGYLDPAQLQPEDKQKTLLEEVRTFEKASLRGDYYEGFDVNWKNSNEMSKDTQAWFAEFEQLLDGCVKQARKDKGSQTLEAFEIVFSLLRRIDEGTDDLLFFADEGGSWQVGVDWTKVLPAWFACLSRAVGPEEYARRAVEVIDAFIGSGREKHLSAARRAATPAQRKALQNHNN